MDDKKRQKSSIPPSVLHNLNEWTTGGYIVFFVNKDGKPEIVGDLDSEITMLGLHSFISSWTKATEEVEVEDLVDSFLTEDCEIIEEDEDDEEDLF